VTAEMPDADSRISSTDMWQCSIAARARGDQLYATAPPARGFLLLEVPGPWGPDLLPASGVRADVAHALKASADEAGLRLLLIRRPGMHPDLGGTRQWAVVAIGGAIRWGHWDNGAELLRIDLGFEREASVIAGPGDALPLALVCTQGRHDLCCATAGRPVVSAAALSPDVDVWECSHLGGDRFAANLLWLPSGHLFGGLDANSVSGIVQAAVTGRVVLTHFRGRCGDAPAAQAAQYHLLRRLGEGRPERIEIVSVGRLPAEGVPFSVHARHAQHDYEVRLAWHWSAPHQLTCRAQTSARTKVFTLADQGPNR
jgi:sucrase/ferredoxin-like protein